MTLPLEAVDPAMHNLIRREGLRQQNTVNLIASENYASRACMEASGSVMCNKYSEGSVGRRYYAGNAVIDEAEQLCVDRALACFGLDPAEWGVNVQSLSGTPANFQVYTALLEPGERLMGLHLPDGGHLSHGFSTPTRAISSTSRFFDCRPYYVDPATERIDYDALEREAEAFRPKLIVAGSSAHSRALDYARIRRACDETGAYLLADMSHISGLVAAECLPSPFPHADVVTTTTHKSLRGPRGALIFYRKPLQQAIDFAVFPGLQGGPHLHTIAAVATALMQASTPEFRAYQRRVMRNAACLASELAKRGYRIVSNGTDMHMFVVDLSAVQSSDDDLGECGVNLNGAQVEKVLESVGIVVNKNALRDDASAWTPRGIRIGTHAVTTRGYDELDMRVLAKLIDRGIRIGGRLGASQHDRKITTLAEFTDLLKRTTLIAATPIGQTIHALKNDVRTFIELRRR